VCRAEAESKTVCKFSRGVRLIVVLRFYDVGPRKDKRGVRIVFDCRMVNDAATIKGQHK